MPKLLRLTNKDDSFAGYMFHCPGCGYCHLFETRWTFNGDMEKPTFSPSMLVNGIAPDPRCHLFVRDGKIQYLADCEHELAGKTVEMVEDW